VLSLHPIIIPLKQVRPFIRARKYDIIRYGCRVFKERYGKSYVWHSDRQGPPISQASGRTV